MMKFKQITCLAVFGLALSAPAAWAATYTQSCNENLVATTPDKDFIIDKTNGIVIHKTTGLMWKRCLQGLSGADCATGSGDLVYWKDALNKAQTDNTAGYSDWRIPNIKELNSIVERRCARPSINKTVFPTEDYTYTVWSSSHYSKGNLKAAAWSVEFDGGSDNYKLEKSAHQNNVRLVRTIN